MFIGFVLPLLLLTFFFGRNGDVRIKIPCALMCCLRVTTFGMTPLMNNLAMASFCGFIIIDLFKTFIPSCSFRFVFALFTLLISFSNNFFSRAVNIY